jgi:prophage antirepressor-like protein
VLLAPFWGAWCMWLGWRTCVRVAPWFGYQPHYRHHGNYYEFDGRQVRVWFAVTELWVAVDDVLDVMGYTGEARDIVRIRAVAGDDAVLRIEGLRPWVFTEEGLRLWLARRGGDTAHRFARWFEQEVVAPFRKRRALDAQAQQRANEAAP